MFKKLKRKYRITIKFIIFAFLFLLLSLSLYAFVLGKTTKIIYKDIEKILKEETLKRFKYEECVSNLVNNDQLKIQKEELKKYILNKYPNTSIKYFNLNTKLDFSYNEKEVYYGASLIKVLTALYIYEEAIENPSILDNTMIYTSKYVKAYSLEMKKRKVGEKVTIRDLVKYSISVSDNSAHFMLVDYIGFDKLKEYGNSIGNKYTLIGGDKYGNIDLNDAFNYMYLVNKYINEEKLGKELRKSFDNEYYNYLIFDDVNVLHKYGFHKMYFHDIGIVEDKNPYIIVILSRYGLNDKETILKNISSKVRDFHNYYKNLIEKVCISK